MRTMGMKKSLLSRVTDEEDLHKNGENVLGLPAPASDIEVQEECVQMEEIEMQHRIH